MSKIARTFRLDRAVAAKIVSVQRKLESKIGLKVSQAEVIKLAINFYSKEINRRDNNV